MTGRRWEGSTRRRFAVRFAAQPDREKSCAAAGLGCIENDEASGRLCRRRTIGRAPPRAVSPRFRGLSSRRSFGTAPRNRPLSSMPPSFAPRSHYGIRPYGQSITTRNPWALRLTHPYGASRRGSQYLDYYQAIQHIKATLTRILHRCRGCSGRKNTNRIPTVRTVIGPAPYAIGPSTGSVEPK